VTKSYSFVRDCSTETGLFIIANESYALAA
jgi:hypothetical protein